LPRGKNWKPAPLIGTIFANGKNAHFFPLEKIAVLLPVMIFTEPTLHKV
jgi:hypothetical protein